jgi:repressor LexA
MTNAEIGRRISSAREELHMTKRELAARVGKAESTIGRYESGAIENINLLVIQAIADALGVSPSWIIGKSSEKRAPIASFNIIPIGKGSRVPLYGRVACGPPILAVEELEETAWLPQGVRADFALTACGDSMINARIFDRDIVYIRVTEVNNGDIAVVIVRDEEVTLKRFYYYPDEGRMVLRAENPTVRAQEYVGEELGHVRVLGKAVSFLSAIR